jgi:hypothetical protein
MALKLSYTQKTGVVGNYWKINSIVTKTGVMHIELYLYVDQKTRDENWDALMLINKDIPYTLEELNKEGVNPYSFCYNYLKTPVKVEEPIEREAPKEVAVIDFSKAEDC